MYSPQDLCKAATCSIARLDILSSSLKCPLKFKIRAGCSRGTDGCAGLQQSYRKAVTNTRRDKQKAGRPAGLTEEQKLEIRYSLRTAVAESGTAAALLPSKYASLKGKDKMASS